MKETRWGKFGRNLGVVVNCLISTIPAPKRAQYRSMLLKDVRKYSFEPKRRDEKPNSGCTYELEGIDLINPSNPWEMAKFVKENFNLAYNKETAKRVYDGFFETV